MAAQGQTCRRGVCGETWSPEAAGDYVAGPSHVLPTGGAARMFSGLTVDDFRKRTSTIAFTKADLQAAAEIQVWPHRRTRRPRQIRPYQVRTDGMPGTPSPSSAFFFSMPKGLGVPGDTNTPKSGTAPCPSGYVGVGHVGDWALARRIAYVVG